MNSKQITIRVSGGTVSLGPMERYLNHLYEIINRQKKLSGGMLSGLEPPKSFSVVIDWHGGIRLHGLEDHVSSLLHIIRENFTCIKNREDFSCLKSLIDEQEKADWNPPILLTDVYANVTSQTD